MKFTTILEALEFACENVGELNVDKKLPATPEEYGKCQRQIAKFRARLVEMYEAMAEKASYFEDDY